GRQAVTGLARGGGRADRASAGFERRWQQFPRGHPSEGGILMSASTTCRRPGEQAGGLRLPASPVLLAGAALMQRLLTSGQRKRARGRDEQAGPSRADEDSGDRDEVTGGDNEAAGSRGHAAAGRRKQAKGCRQGRGTRTSRGRCCTVPRRLLSMAVAGASVALMARGVQERTSAHTTLDPHTPEASSHLVTTGPFASTRNP